MAVAMLNAPLSLLIYWLHCLPCTAQIQVGDLITEDATTPLPPMVSNSLVSFSTLAPIVRSPSGVSSELGEGPVTSLPPIIQAQAKQAAYLLEMKISTTPSASLIEAVAPNILRKSRRDISRKSEDIIEGLLEAYLHEQELQPGEKTCLRTLVAKVGGDIISAGDDAVKAIREMAAKDKDSMDIMTVVADAGIKVTDIVRLAKEIVKDCVKGDVLETLNKSAKHLMNMTYVGNRLLANGADIAEVLAESVIDWDKGDYRDVGEHIGEALRKILLSRASKEPPLPEGMPKSRIIAEVTSGVMNGFFVEGSELTIKDLAAPNVDIKIDLHDCIAENELFFQSAFRGVWTVIAQMATNKGQFGHLFDVFKGTQNARRLVQQHVSDGMSELALAMVQIPGALRKCNIDKDTEDMLSDAIKSLQWARFDFDFPKEKLNEKEVRELMARAVESWTRFRFEDFGDDVGQLLRSMVLLVFPKKYEVDKAGHLRRGLIAEAAAYRTNKQPFVLSAAAFVVGCATATLAAVFLAGRAFQTGAWRRYDSLSRRDISRLDEPREGGSDDPCRAALGINADIGFLEA